MTEILAQTASASTDLPPLPDHTQLPESDGTFVFAKRAGAAKTFKNIPKLLY